VQYGAVEDFDGSYNLTIIVANDQGGSRQTSFSWTINQVRPLRIFGGIPPTKSVQ
jgi:hypothetical protein